MGTRYFVVKEKERLAIRVWDSGCGMDEKELETLKNMGIFTTMKVVENYLLQLKLLEHHKNQRLHLRLKRKTLKIFRRFLLR